MKDVVIVSACRTAIGVFGGTLKDSNCATLASVVMKEAVKRAGIDAASISDIRFGNCMEPVDALNVARIGALLAGIPQNPNRFRPDRHPDRAAQRRTHVLNRMLATDAITPAQHAEAMRARIAATAREARTS